MSIEVRTARDFMRSGLVTLLPETPLIDGVTRLLKNSISGAPVVDVRGKYLGVFSEKCSLNAMTDTVEQAIQTGAPIERARDFMTRRLVTLSPDVDVFAAIDHLLAKQISGAPVLDDKGRFEGVFSEKTAMRVLISAAYDQLPGTNVGSYMNTEQERIIGEDSSLVDIARKFQSTPYRRLPVLVEKRLAGQVSRRDVLRSQHRVAKSIAARASDGCDLSSLTSSVESHMDENAKTISGDTDMLVVAQLFSATPYRRLPVVHEGKLVGQVSRRDLLGAAARLLRPDSPQLPPKSLYVSVHADDRPSLLK